MQGEFCTLNRCYFNDVQTAKDENLKKFFFMYSFKVTSHPCEMALPKVTSCGCEVDAKWEWPHMVTLCGIGDNLTPPTPKVTLCALCAHARWMWGENGCARWTWSEVTLCGGGDNLTYTPPKSPHAHASWTRGENAYVRHLVKFFTPWYFYDIPTHFFSFSSTFWSVEFFTTTIVIRPSSNFVWSIIIGRLSDLKNISLLCLSEPIWNLQRCDRSLCGVNLDLSDKL